MFGTVCAKYREMTVTKPTEKLILIGNGMAGGRFLSDLIETDPDPENRQYDVTVFGAEPHGNYNRIMLSPVLAGEKELDDITLNTIDWYAENKITLHTSSLITKIDRQAKKVILENGDQFDYDKLVIATGSNPFIIPVAGNDLDGVISFRDIKDVDSMIEAAKTHDHAVVIGGGLLGLEAANGLMIQGMDVTVVHRSNCLMDRQLDQVAGESLQASLEERGLKFKMGAETTEFAGDDQRVLKVNFADGTSIKADLVVMAAGIRPNYKLAEDAQLECGRGVIVDDQMQTSDPDIYAIGECVEHRGVSYGLVAPLYEMAKVCVENLIGKVSAKYEGTITSTKLKVTGIDVFSVGDFFGSEQSESLTLSDPANAIYRKLVIENNKLTGAVLYGETSHSVWYMDLIIEGKDIKTIRDSLMFGPESLEETEQAA